MRTTIGRRGRLTLALALTLLASGCVDTSMFGSSPSPGAITTIITLTARAQLDRLRRRRIPRGILEQIADYA